jgi:hypothetical protein
MKYRLVGGADSWAVFLLTVSSIGPTQGAEPIVPPVQQLPAEAIVRFAGSSTLDDFGGQLPPNHLC